MAGRSDIKAGSAYVELLLKQNQFTQGLRSAGKQLKSFGTGIAAVGAGFLAMGSAITAPLAIAVKEFLTFGDTLDKMRQRTGISVEALSELGHAAEQSGTDLSTLENGVRKMQKALTAAAQGGSADAFRALGLSVAALEKLSPEDQFTKIGAAINNLKDPTQKAAAAMAIFGKSGTQLLPMLEDVGELRQEARDLGLTMSGEAAGAAVKLGDMIDNLFKSVKAAGVAIGTALAPALTSIVEKMQTGLTSVVKWVQSHSELVVMAAKVGVALTAAGAAITAIGVAIAGAGVAFSGLATGIGIVGTILGVVVSPLGLVAGALLAVAKIALGRFLPSLKDMASFAQDTFAKISEAVGPALENLMGIVTSVFSAIIEFLTPILAAIGDAIVAAWDPIVTYVTPILDAFGELVIAVFTACLDITKAVWGAVAPIVVGAFKTIYEYAAPVLNWLQGAVITTFKAVTFAFQNWRQLGTLAIQEVTLAMVTFGNDVEYWFTEALPQYLAWFGRNWKEIFKTVASFVVSVDKNIIANLQELGSSIVENLKEVSAAISRWLSGEDFTFNFKAPTFKPLLDGFENTIEKLPVIAKREMSKTEKEMRESIGRIKNELGQAWQDINAAGQNGGKLEGNGREPSTKERLDAEKKRDAEKQKDKDKVNKAAADGELLNTKPEIFSTFSAAAAQVAGRGGGGDPVAKQSLDELRKLRKAMFDQNKELARQRYELAKGGAFSA